MNMSDYRAIVARSNANTSTNPPHPPPAKDQTPEKQFIDFPTAYMQLMRQKEQESIAQITASSGDDVAVDVQVEVEGEEHDINDGVDDIQKNDIDKDDGTYERSRRDSITSTEDSTWDIISIPPDDTSTSPPPPSIEYSELHILRSQLHHMTTRLVASNRKIWQLERKIEELEGREGNIARVKREEEEEELRRVYRKYGCVREKDAGY